MATEAQTEILHQIPLPLLSVLQPLVQAGIIAPDVQIESYVGERVCGRIDSLQLHEVCRDCPTQIVKDGIVGRCVREMIDAEFVCEVFPEDIIDSERIAARQKAREGSLRRSTKIPGLPRICAGRRICESEKYFHRFAN